MVRKTKVTAKGKGGRDGVQCKATLTALHAIHRPIAFSATFCCHPEEAKRHMSSAHSPQKKEDQQGKPNQDDTDVLSWKFVWRLAWSTFVVSSSICSMLLVKLFLVYCDAHMSGAKRYIFRSERIAIFGYDPAADIVEDPENFDMHIMIGILRKAFIIYTGILSTGFCIAGVIYVFRVVCELCGKCASRMRTQE